MKITGRDEWVTFAGKDTSRIHLVTVSPRAGATAFAGMAEWVFYPPGTADNALFDNHIVEWSGFDWFILTVPRADFSRFADLAATLCLKVKQHPPSLVKLGASAVVMTVDPETPWPTLSKLLVDRGIPKALLGNASQMETFPGPTDRMFALENDDGNPVYRNRIREIREIIGREVELLSCLREGDRPTAQQAADYIYGPGVLPRKG